MYFALGKREAGEPLPFERCIFKESVKRAEVNAKMEMNAQLVSKVPCAEYRILNAHCHSQDTGTL